MGELGFLMPRLNEVNEAISMVGGTDINSNCYFWSSSEPSPYYACFLYTNNGYTGTNPKTNDQTVRPFICI